MLARGAKGARVDAAERLVKEAAAAHLTNGVGGDKLRHGRVPVAAGRHCGGRGQRLLVCQTRAGAGHGRGVSGALEAVVLMR